MPYKDKQKNKESQEAYRKKKLQWIQDLKRVPCMDCGGQFNPWQMHFDHRPGEEKLFQIGTKKQSRSVQYSWVV